MSRLAKKKNVKSNPEPSQNASPVCYLESDEVRPEYHIDYQSKTQKNTKAGPEK